MSVDDVKATTLKENKNKKWKENVSLLFMEMNTNNNPIWIDAQTLF